MSVLVIAIILFSDSALPLPVTNERPPPQYVAWHSQPNERGSFGLIFNCIITLSLCVWTAVHLNVPALRPKGPVSRFKRIRNSYSYTRFQWMLLGLLAPELAVYAAWRQWASARILARKMNEILLEKKQGKQEGSEEDIDTAPHNWTLIHGFYASMGGFVMDTHNPKVGEYIPGSPRLTLTAEGVLFLAENGYRLPYLTAESIRDRSKADGLAKSLVCLQAGYMIVQCSGRLAAKLPISLLEINTLGHVICALIMYLFWLKKPQDIHEPTLVRLDGMDSVCAYAWMSGFLSKSSRGEDIEMRELCFYPGIDTAEVLESSSASRPGDDAEDISASALGHEDQLEDRESSTLLSASASSSMAVQVPLAHRYRQERTSRSEPLPTRRITLKSVAVIGENEVLRGSQIGPANAEKVVTSKKISRRSKTFSFAPSRSWQPASIDLNEIDVRRWRLASAFLNKQQRPKINDINDHGENSEGANERGSELQELSTKDPIIFRYHKHTCEPFLVVKAVPNWAENAGLLSSFEELPWIIISITTGLYGGLHATAWYSHFPSSAEHILWCASCIIIASSGILTGLLITVDRLPQKLGWKPSQSTSHKDSAIGYYFSDHEMGNWDILFSMVVLAVGMSFALPAALAVLFYIPARMFIVIEAFIGLRNAPVETYITPDWTEWIPHL